MRPNMKEDSIAAIQKFERVYNVPKIIFRKMTSSKIGATIAGIIINIGLVRVISIINCVLSEPGAIPTRDDSMTTEITCAKEAKTNPIIDQVTICFDRWLERT